MKNKLKDLSDAELVIRSQKGSASAFGEIYDRYSPGVARALASFAGPDRDLLDDLTQDVFLRVIRNLASYISALALSTSKNPALIRLRRLIGPRPIG